MPNAKVEVWAVRVDGCELVVRGSLDDELKSRLREHKAELLALFAEPTEPYSACSAGSYHQTEPGGPWLCSVCTPRTEPPAATLTVPGGRSPTRKAQNPDTIIAAAVDGLPITASEFRAWLNPDDLADIAAGRIPVDTVRGYAGEFARQQAAERPLTLADKLRAHGGLLKFERGDEAPFWIAADEGMATEVERSGRTPCLTAAEAEQLGAMEPQDMRALLELKREFGGRMAQMPPAVDVGRTVGGVRV